MLFVTTHVFNTSAIGESYNIYDTSAVCFACHTGARIGSKGSRTVVGRTDFFSHCAKSPSPEYGNTAQHNIVLLYFVRAHVLRRPCHRDCCAALAFVCVLATYASVIFYLQH